MGRKNKFLHKKHGSRFQRIVAVMLFLCLLLSQLNVKYILTYAEESKTVSIQAGENVTAALKNGVLTLSGEGKTKDYTAEETPFLEYAGDIRQVVIEEGITYIGSYLFYGLGNLQGKLTLPESITGFGDSVFSGNSKKTSAGFTEIINNAKADQRVENNNTLFCQGQTGSVQCKEENKSFMEAASYAGYEPDNQPQLARDTSTKDQSTDTAIKNDLQSSLTRSVKRAGAKLTETVVYVDQDAGDDTSGDGSKDSPYKTLDQAGAHLATEENGGTVYNNKIVLLSDYHLDATDNTADRFLFLKNPRPVTVTGQNKNIKFGWKEDDIKSNGTVNVENAFINLQDHIRFTSVYVENIAHIYGCGNDTIMDEEVSNNKDFYLYGAGRSGIIDNKVGEIKTYSGKITRIIGYVRSTPDLDAMDLEAKITVGGTAVVQSIIGGSASGKIKNGKVTINIEGGRVSSQVVGGNQGYLKGDASFKGTAAINVTGGTVSNLYGAGLGRNQSIPTYLGNIDINVTGGTVSNLYGAGSAAYVVSGDSVTSSVDISVTDGTVGNIYAAGEGGDTAVKNETGSTIDYPEKMGSLTGFASINISGSAKITGSIYGSGKGYHTDTTNYDTSENAFLVGNSKISLSGGIIEGSVYGGGGGLDINGYEESARVEGSASVTLSGGTIKGNLFGGGKQGKVYGNTELNIRGGTVNGSVYGGALGQKGKTLVSGQTTVNMTDGWIRGNLYGGSELSNNGPEGANDDLIFVNLSGGEVSGNVFGGGYQGKVNGSTHLHIGILALDECNYYMAHEDQKPELSVSKVLVSGSVYAGGDYGGDTVNYDEITVSGTSHVYIDGKGYKTGTEGSEPEMTVSGGVFGSGASCDAGSTRIVTLLNYGEAIKDADGEIKGATRTLNAIQRADRVVLRNSHVELKGQSDVANANQTALYSLNRVGDHGNIAGLGTLGNGLILQSGSTMMLDSAVIEIARFKSLDEGGKEVALGEIQDIPNTVLFSQGTIFRISYTDTDGKEIYGDINGYAYMAAENTAVGYAYARTKTDSVNQDDGGFADPSDSSKELGYKNIGSDYRYWRIAGTDATSTRNTVLTAQTLESGDNGYGTDGYSVAHGSIELPPAENGSSYTVRSISLPSGVTLVESGKDGLKGSWSVSGTGINTADEKAKIDNNPLTAFGLYMKFGSGFKEGSSESVGNVISNKSAGDNSIIGKEISYSGSDGIPKLDFYLTFNNAGITASQDLGTVKVELARKENGSEKETTTINVQLLTKATALSDQTVDLYATQGGSYNGNLIIPSGTARKLSLTGVAASAGGSFIKASSSISGNQFSITMKPVTGQGWSSSGLMTEAYDLASYTSGSNSIGTTDSRYEAAIEFHLKNASGFTAKDNPDTVKLTFYDESEGSSITITLNIHWKKSVVSSINRAAGKVYDDVGNPDSIQISSHSAVTAAFQMDILNTEETQKLWLELQTGKGSKAVLPAGTKLTMLYSDGFYSYQVTGAEANNRVPLSDFKKMWGVGGLSNVSSGLLTVITDFDSAEGLLATGDYSLRLRSDTGADSIGAGFTVDNSDVSLETTGTGGFSKGQQSFTLKVNRNSDTRFMDTAAAVITQDEIPKGTVFTCQGKTYYPNGGSVYIPLSVGEKISVIMNTENTAGLTPGGHTLSVRIFPAGVHAGGTDSVSLTKQLAYDVKDNPSYSLTAEVTEGSRRTEPGKTLKFDVGYVIKNTDQSSKTEVKVQKKSGADYEDMTGWTITGNDSVHGEGIQNISVTIPQNAAAGTYRLNFTLENRTVSYNIVVAK